MKSKVIVSSVVVAAAIMASALLSGKIEINLQHHLSLPAEFSNKAAIEVTEKRSFFADYFNPERVIHVRVGAEFKGIDSVREIGRILQDADENDTVIFHIAGNGGEVDTVMYLISNVKASKARTVMIVEGPSYSGHAYLAAAGDELRVLQYGFMMFHTSSAYGKDCSKEKGFDRTVPNKIHCQAFLDNHLKETTAFLNTVTFLTTLEKELIESGYDVYITSQEYHKRTGL